MVLPRTPSQNGLWLREPSLSVVASVDLFLFIIARVATSLLLTRIAGSRTLLAGRLEAASLVALP